jgi:HAD superfamily hydrolase (TIGR01509 family)
MSRPTLRALTFDFWDTLYDGTNLEARLRLRRDAVADLLEAYRLTSSPEELDTLYREGGREFERWWRDERGYTTHDRLHWMMRRAGIEPRDACEHVSEAARVIDEALLHYPPPLLDGAADAVAALSKQYPLAIISDTGFASGHAQNALLERDGLLAHFTATIYSCDIGVPKPRREMFDAALSALGTSPGDTLHIGDIERTDVRGALSVGMRAVRLDVLRDSGTSEAEAVARSYREVLAWIQRG